MAIAESIQQEINVLAQFNPASSLEGIKIHQNADTSVIEAAQRLFDKGLISQVDGGYLTALGQEAVRHLDSLMTVLK